MNDEKLFRFALWVCSVACCFVLIRALVSCASCPEGSIQSPAGDPSCVSACDNLIRLGCPGGRGSPGVDERFGSRDDRSCSAVCRELEREPTFDFPVDCVSRAADCKAADRCFE